MIIWISSFNKYLPSKHRERDGKMRKGNKLVSCTNREVLFAQGVEQIIAEKTLHPTHYRDYELDSILRKERALSKLNRNRQFSFGLLIADVQNTFVWRISPNSAWISGSGNWLSDVRVGLLNWFWIDKFELKGTQFIFQKDTLAALLQFTH